MALFYINVDETLICVLQPREYYLLTVLMQFADPTNDRIRFMVNSVISYLTSFQI